MATKKKTTEQPAELTEQQKQEEAKKKHLEEMKKEAIAVLKKAAGDREGVDYIIEDLEKNGFFTAPASGGNHGHVEGGLLEHSLNVLHNAEKISAALIGTKNITPDMKNSIAICALLHDYGKVGDFGKQFYVPNILKSGNVSTAKPWQRNKDLTNIPHGIRSIILVERWMELKEDEEYAIAYHDGLYEPSNVSVIKGHETQILMIIHWADMWASHVQEGESADDE